MDRQQIIQQINKEKCEKMELARKLRDFEGGCSYQFECITNDIMNQIIAKNDNIKYLCSLLYSDEQKYTSPREALLIIVFIISIIAIIVSK